MRKYFALLMILCCIFPDAMHAQKLAVKSLEVSAMDISASQHERKSDDGTSCALLKVLMTDDIEVADDNVVGSIENHGTEKWMYLKPCTTQLTITAVGRAPLTIRFATYGIEKLTARSTYELTLVEDDRRTETFNVNGVSFCMVQVDGGTFKMGYIKPHPANNPDYKGDSGHRVMLSTYMIGETEVTQELWQAVMGKNPSRFKGAGHPVEKVSWNDCQKFISKLNALTGREFRLPTEAEWEFAARGGNKSRGTLFSGSDNVDLVAWHHDNAKITTHPVAQKMPNEIGLYDMSGNVCEWCHDWYDFYPETPKRDPQGPDKPNSDFKVRMIRGGSAYSCWTNGVDCYVHQRFAHYEHSVPSCRSESIGVRLAMSVK